MATATLVHQGAHRLRYLIAQEGTGAETVAITTIGSPTPDTLTDAIGPGVINKLSKVVADGYGGFAAGAQTAAKSRGLWTSDLSVATGADPSSGSPNGAKLPTAKLAITPRAGANTWGLLATVNAGNPEIHIAISAGAGGGIAYLDIFSPNTIGI